MYSLTNRLNSICFFFLTTLAGVSFVNFVTGYFSQNQILPKLNKFEIRDFPKFEYITHWKQDQLYLKFDLDVDFTEQLDWNTYAVFAWIQVRFKHRKTTDSRSVIWDSLLRPVNKQKVTDPDLHNIPALPHVRLDNQLAEYPVRDSYGILKESEPAEVWLAFEHMPLVGVNYKREMKIGSFEFPKFYKVNKKIPGFY